MFGSAPRRSLLSTFVLALSLCSVASADHTPAKRHHAVNRVEYPSSAATLGKRTDNAKFTYYETGEGACGAQSKDSDWVRAALWMCILLPYTDNELPSLGRCHEYRCESRLLVLVLRYTVLTRRPVPAIRWRFALLQAHHHFLQRQDRGRDYRR